MQCRHTQLARTSLAPALHGPTGGDAASGPATPLARPQAIHAYVRRPGRDRRHNHVRRWRYRGVDKLRRQQHDDSAVHQSLIDDAY